MNYLKRKYLQLYDRLTHVPFTLTKSRIFLGIFGGCISILALGTALWGNLLYTNVSPSAPSGIYMATPDQTMTYGDYAVVSCPVDLPELHIPKGYKILKKAAAFPGDTYTVSSTALYTGGKSYHIFHNANLPRLPLGTFTVPEGTILFLNDPADSLDSRYLGPIPTAFLDKRVTLLLNYASLDNVLLHFF